MSFKHKFGRLGLAFLSILVCFVVLELLLALFWPQTVVLRSLHEQYHPLMGWTNKPGKTGKVYIDHGNYFHRTHNGKGLRSLREFDYDPPGGTKRILLVGDSFFWGYGVDDEDVISEALQRRLGDKIEVINGAVTGYGTDQSLIWLLEEGFKYRPDLIILSVFPTNDLKEISSSVSYGYPKPYFSFGDGKLILNNVPVPDTMETRRKAFEKPGTAFGRLKQFLRYNVHSYQFIIGRLNSISAVRRLFLYLGLAEDYTPALHDIPMLTLKKEHVLALLDALLVEFKKVADEAEADFLLVFIPAGKDAPDARNAEMAFHLSGLAGENEMKFLDLLPVVLEHEKSESIYLSEKDGHWSADGHRLAADAILEHLKNTDGSPLIR